MGDEQKQILMVNLNPDATWCRLGPIFWEVGVNSIDRVRDVGDPSSNQTWIRSLQPLHHRSVGYQPRTTDWPRQEGFSCKRIEEHKQESINAQSKLQVWMNWR